MDKSKNVRSTLSDLGNNVTAAVLIVMIVVVASLGLRNAALVEEDECPRKRQLAAEVPELPEEERPHVVAEQEAVLLLVD